MGGHARPVVGALLLWAALAIVPGAALAAPGDLDTTFASAGAYTAPFMTTFPGAEDSQTVAADSLGRVYLSATEEPQLNGGPVRHVKVVRLTTAGVPDAGFGSGGIATLALPSTDVRNAGIVIDALDRPIVLVNTGEGASSQRIGLARLTTAGQPDASFDGDGYAEGPIGPGGWNTWPAGIALDPSGNILVVGTLISGSTRHAGFVARFGAGGALQTAYGTSGWTELGGPNTELSAIQALPGGGAVVAGYNYDEWIVGRVTSGGALDSGFDGDGVARSSLGKGALDLVSDYGLTVDASGRPIVVGQFTPHNGNAGALVARWTSAGAPDATFGTGTPAPGAVILPNVNARGEDAAVQCDGKILVLASGSFPGDTRNRALLARLGETGALDTTFAPASPTPGIASYQAGQNNTALDVALTPAGAYVAGFRRQNDGGVFTDAPQVMRFTGTTCGDVPPVVQPPTDPIPADPVPAAAAVSPATPAPTPAAPPAAQPVLKIADLVVFPSTRRCASRRRFPIRLRVPDGAAVRQAVVKVNGERVAVRNGDRLRSTVNLTKLPKGRFKVTIQLTLTSGRTISGTRAYRTCTVKRTGSKPKV